MAQLRVKLDETEGYSERNKDEWHHRFRGLLPTGLTEKKDTINWQTRRERP